MQAKITDTKPIRFKAEGIYNFFSNTANLGIQFWMDGAFYSSNSIETAYLGIQGYIPHKGKWKNDSDEKTPTRNIARKFISITDQISEETQFLFQQNVPGFFHDAINPADKELGDIFNLKREGITVKEQLMYELLLIKATQNIEILKSLLLTGNKEIIADIQQDNPESFFWGNQENALGKAWMQVRETLSEELFSLKKIRVREELSGTLMCFYFGMDQGKNIFNKNSKYIDNKKINETYLFLTTEEIQADRTNKMPGFHRDSECYDYSNTPNYSIYSPDPIILYKGHIAPDVNEFPLHVAAYDGNIDAGKRLLAACHAPDENDTGGIFTEADTLDTEPNIRGHISTIRVGGRSPLYLACSMAKKALHGSAYINVSPLCQSKNTYAEIVRSLLECNADPLAERKGDRIFDRSFTPIHLAIMSGNFEVTKLFREFKNSEGKSYMRCFLEQYGCHIKDQFDCESVNYPGTEKKIFLGGYPILFQAAQNSDIEIITDIFNYAKEFAIKPHGPAFFSEGNPSNLNERNAEIKNYLNTTRSDHPYEYALHAAVRSDCLEVVKLLVEYGADPTKTDRNGETPADRAKNLDYNEIYAYLKPLEESARLCNLSAKPS